MSFWDCFDDANAVAAEAMGEPMVVAGTQMMGVVTSLVTVEDGAAPGGRRMTGTGEVLVPGSITPEDGMRVVVRGMTLRTLSWERMGAGEESKWALRLGPEQRWSGQVPGL